MTHPSATSGRAPVGRFLLCLALVLALEFVLLAAWFALPEFPLRSLAASSRVAVTDFAHRFRDAVTLARLYFVGFQYLTTSLVVMFCGWLFWIGRSGWRFGILKAAVLAAHAALIIVSFRLYRFASVYIFLAVMLTVILFAARWLWRHFVDGSARDSA